MNQTDTGKFIARCRKEIGLTQARLAAKLNITDRAVSKWETGKSMPDPSIMLELCNILGVTVNELLSGEKIGASHYEEKASEDLIASTRKEENSTHKNAVMSIIYTVVMVVGILVCCICDIAVSGTLSWSLMVLSSVLITWITSFPVISFGKKGVLAALLAISILILPYMYIISALIKVDAVFRIGTVMSMIALVYLWIVYFLYRRLKVRKLLATGIAFLLVIPFTFLINFTLSKMIGGPAIDVWDILSALILLITAVAFFAGDHVRKRKCF